jgi:hypothetical protein
VRGEPSDPPDSFAGWVPPKEERYECCFGEGFPAEDELAQGVAILSIAFGGLRLVRTARRGWIRPACVGSRFRRARAGGIHNAELQCTSCGSRRWVSTHPSKWREFSIEHEGVEVGPVETRGGPSDQLLIVALVPLEQHPEVDRDGLVQVPDEARRQGEAALQHAADMLSVTTGGGRALASPSLPVAFKADTSDERAWLQGRWASRAPRRPNQGSP